MEAILTPAGYRLVVKAAPGHIETVRELLIDSLSHTQLRALAVAGRRVLAKIDPGSQALSPTRDSPKSDGN